MVRLKVRGCASRWTRLTAGSKKPDRGWRAAGDARVLFAGRWNWIEAQ